MTGDQKMSDQNPGDMTLKSCLVVAATLVMLNLPISAAAQDDLQQSAYEQARVFMQQAFAADGAGNHAEATTLLEKALALRPNHPGLLFAAAQTSASAGSHEAAFGFLERLAGLGISVNLDRAEAFNALKDDQRWMALADAMASNGRPTGKAKRTLQTKDTLLLVEGVAFDKTRDRFLLSSIHDRRIAVATPDGAVTDFADAESGLLSPTGMKVDATNDRLLVASASTPQTPGLGETDAGRSALLAFDLASGALQQTWEAGEGEHWFGDVTIGKDGALYISDSLQKELYVIPQGADEITALVAHPDFVSPQGLTLSDDGSFLYLADYAMGLFRITLTTGLVERLMPSGDLAPYGIDGLYFYGGDLIAIQNGVRPNRVIRINLTEDGSKIESSDILLAAHSDFLEPTLGVIAGDSLHLVANSGWPHFTKPPVDANVLRTELPATIVLEVALKGAGEK